MKSGDDIEAFLGYVMNFVAANPESATRVGMYAEAGLRKALNEAYERAADMEVALVAATPKRMKNSDEIIKSKLTKWEGKTSCRWDWYTGAKSG